jgi:hypothetical protein
MLSLISLFTDSIIVKTITWFSSWAIFFYACEKKKNGGDSFIEQAGKLGGFVKSVGEVLYWSGFIGTIAGNVGQFLMAFDSFVKLLPVIGDIYEQFGY